ncbi:hypothetical protein DEO72_LG5g2799 [Vigna unguiculata]|uniref:Uncharacterized protein n=1 Tax=Vigna unguiculata TaxID=3917 RepID=A0A4D6M3T6_VIGUN|nr:hypothetical protein DEO72_LG5g2799 [Vigna unguiculata]
MEEEYARGGDGFDVEEPQSRHFEHPSSSHQPEPSSFDKGDAFDVEEPQSRDCDGCDVEEPQSRHFEQHEQGTPEYNPHGMEIISYVEPPKCSLDVDLTQLYRILVSQNGRQVVVDINHQILTTVECWGFHP